MNLTIWSRLGTLAAMAVAVMLAGTACSGAGTDAAGGDAASMAPADAATAIAPPAAEIDQYNLEFVPAQVTVRVGEVVLIKNGETAIHNAVVNGKNVTGNMKKGDTIPWKAPAAGEYTVTCDYHLLMKATIVVIP